MTVQELIDDLQKVEDKGQEVIMGIIRLVGFKEYDHIEYFPVEGTYQRNLDVADCSSIQNYPLEGYSQDKENRNKTLLYVYP
jgi:hypothetical protein